MSNLKPQPIEKQVARTLENFQTILKGQVQHLQTLHDTISKKYPFIKLEPYVTLDTISLICSWKKSKTLYRITCIWQFAYHSNKLEKIYFKCARFCDDPKKDYQQELQAKNHQEIISFINELN